MRKKTSVSNAASSGEAASNVKAQPKSTRMKSNAQEVQRELWKEQKRKQRENMSSQKLKRKEIARQRYQATKQKEKEKRKQKAAVFNQA